MATPERPEDVPATAKWNKQEQYWEDGSATSARHRWWSEHGQVLLDAPRLDGKLHGDVRWNLMIADESQFDARVAFAKALGLPDGPANAMIATFDRGVLQKVVFRVGFDEWVKDTAVVTVADGKPTRIEWKVGPLNGDPLWEYNGLRIDETMLPKLPKPWPEKLVATFANGKLVSHTFLDAKGKVVGGPAPIKDWGAKTTAKQLAGYLERGDFVKDAKAFFPKAQKVEAENLPKKLDAIAKLAGAKALETAVRKKQLPWMGMAFDLTYFGQSAKDVELDGVADAKYLTLGTDGSGDYYLLDTQSGKVHVYLHEESKLDKKAFDSIDAFAWAMLRVEAAQQGLIPKADVKKTLKALGIDAAAAML